jgi:hypothetical protein
MDFAPRSSIEQAFDPNRFFFASNVKWVAASYA